MTNPDYWKDQYSHTWAASRSREEKVIGLIRAATGGDVALVGLGAGSDEYLLGSAVSQGFEKGGADLQVVGTPLFLEVTGPQKKGIGQAEPLWLRPDKVANARAHPEHETWVVHCLERTSAGQNVALLRVIHMNEEFFASLDAGEFPTVRPVIRGAEERYFAIPAHHRVVQRREVLLDRIRQLLLAK